MPTGDLLSRLRNLLQPGTAQDLHDAALGLADGAWIAGVTLLAVALLAAREGGLLELPAVPSLPLLILGVGLAVLGAAEWSAREARQAERRGALARLLAECRSLAGQALAHVGPADADRAQTLAWRCIAFAHALRDHLRSVPMGEGALTALAQEEGRYAATRSNPPNIVLTVMSREIAIAFSRARMSAESMQTLDDRVAALSGVQATLERLAVAERDLRALLPHRLAILFALLLPFGLVDGSYWAPLVVAILAYAGFAFASLGLDADAAPTVDRVVLSVEISIRDMLGEGDLPPDREVISHTVRHAARRPIE